MEPREFTYETLVEFLENWSTWGEDPAVYDLNGLCGLLGACLQSLHRHFEEVELDTWEDKFAQEEVETLIALAARLEEIANAGENP